LVSSTDDSKEEDEELFEELDELLDCEATSITSIC